MSSWLAWAAADLDAGLVALALIVVARALPRIPAVWRVAILTSALVRLAVPVFPSLVAFPGVSTVDLSAEPVPNVSMIIAVHVLGTACLLFELFIRGNASLRSVLRSSDIAASPRLAQHFAFLAQRAGVRRCTLRLSSSDCGPLACGLMRRVVVIPVRLLQTLTADELDAVLLHELTHHARRDLWLRLAASIVTRVCWFNPVAWLLERELRRATEEATDDAAVARLGHDVARYSTALVRAARSIVHPVAAPAVGLHPLGKRLLRLSKYGAASPALGIAGWALCIAVAAFAMLLQPIQPHAGDDERIAIRNRVVLRTSVAREIRSTQQAPRSQRP